jgi:hypothetical protein
MATPESGVDIQALLGPNVFETLVREVARALTAYVPSLYICVHRR